MAATGMHRIAWQRGNMGLYAEVGLTLEKESRAVAVVSVRGLDAVAEQWRTGVMFGLSLLRETLTGKVDFQHLSVNITSFRGQPADTTLMAAAFASFHAAAKALGVDVSEVFRFDDSTGVFEVSVPDERGSCGN